MKILLHDLNDVSHLTDAELGIENNKGYVWQYDVIDKPLFFMSVIKYGIQFTNLPVNLVGDLRLELEKNVDGVKQV
jgi:hypothetical protein